jgi:uncharacterized damage-inducible protein DinB
VPTQPPRVPPVLDGPGVDVCEPRVLLLEYLDWYREALDRKVAGLSDTDLRSPLEPFGWSPLGMFKHLGWVERRWMRWGFAAEDVVPYLPGDTGSDSDRAEWTVLPDETTRDVLAEYRREVDRSRTLASGAELSDIARLGGRFQTAEQAPCLGRILFHLLQEYARHVGQLDVVRELIDGATGE